MLAHIEQRNLGAVSVRRSDPLNQVYAHATCCVIASKTTLPSLQVTRVRATAVVRPTCKTLERTASVSPRPGLKYHAETFARLMFEGVASHAVAAAMPTRIPP